MLRAQHAEAVKSGLECTRSMPLALLLPSSEAARKHRTISRAHDEVQVPAASHCLVTNGSIVGSEPKLAPCVCLLSLWQGLARVVHQQVGIAVCHHRLYATF